MKSLNSEQRQELLDRLRTMSFLQNLLWREATTISDELLDCELDMVLQQVPDLAAATPRPDEGVTYEDLNDFLDNCQRTVVVQSIAIDISRA